MVHGFQYMLLICSMVFQYMNVLLTISNYLTIDLTPNRIITLKL
jgi:hypothetical protein